MIYDSNDLQYNSQHTLLLFSVYNTNIIAVFLQKAIILGTKTRTKTCFSHQRPLTFDPISPLWTARVPKFSSRRKLTQYCITSFG